MNKLCVYHFLTKPSSGPLLGYHVLFPSSPVLVPMLSKQKWSCSPKWWTSYYILLTKSSFILFSFNNQLPIREVSGQLSPNKTSTFPESKRASSCSWAFQSFQPQPCLRETVLLLRGGHSVSLGPLQAPPDQRLLLLTAPNYVRWFFLLCTTVHQGRNWDH